MSALSWFDDPAWRKPRAALTPKRPCGLAALPAAAQAFAVAGLLHGGKAPALVVAPGVKAQEEFASELEAWAPGLSFLFFPEAEPPVGDALPDPALAAERLAVVRRLQGAAGAGAAPVIVTTQAALDQPLPNPEALGRVAHLEAGKAQGRDAFLALLAEAGYQRELEVSGPGQFSVRGGIVDVFSWASAQPVRSEWDGDEVVSLRLFDPALQRSLENVPRAEVSLLKAAAEGEGEAALADYLPPGTVAFSLGDDAEAEPVSLEFFGHEFLHGRAGDWIAQERRRDLFLSHLRDWMDDEWEIVLAANNEGEERRLREILGEQGIDLEKVSFAQRRLLRGFSWPAARRVILADAEIFGRYQTLRALRRRERALHAPLSRAASISAAALSDWAEGDYVVHLHHGIARYRGMQKLPGEKGETDVLVLQFAEQARLYVPLEESYLISRYLGATKKAPALDQLGGPRWEKARAQAQKAVRDYALKLVRVQAERETLQGFAFPPDNAWQAEFEEAFVYEETPDQLKAIAEAKRDMESPKPMDRLVCGDVGFGKTEVAIRAIFKAVMGGKQASFLVPTTVLAQQHFQNLRERYADYPVRVEILSRYRTPAEQKKVLEGLADGSVDVVVGTHRLLSKDVVFKDLGLVVIDEEQRFGVVQKEKFKQLFRLVDVLTLSATPIPRTLYLAMTGARDLSTIETPPPSRQTVETIISPYDERVIRGAIERELARDGQVYFLHNRVQSIERMAERLRELVPGLRVDIGHGQMDKGDLEDVMRRFVEGRTQVLLATSIIENGLDIPNANTILIDRADRFGLADLYQLRGRVGRSHSKAHAYLLLPREMLGSGGDARKRLGAMRQYAALGSGFKLAMRDLEIRGAGSMLGTAQSGHITSIGFDLYCHLLQGAVSQLKAQAGPDGQIPPLPETDCRVALDFLALHQREAGDARPPALLPSSYLAESRWRVEGYRRLNEAARTEELEALRQDWRDRHGPWPAPVERLLLLHEIRILGRQRRIERIETQGEKLVLKRRGDYIMIGGKFPRLTASGAENKLTEIRSWLLSIA
ncbi:MAG: transcription-repair coupling factor [Verrucomicrobium sp.]|nr:transcription-repair coupling factor [Verrucomicrobium sp.]